MWMLNVGFVTCCVAALAGVYGVIFADNAWFASAIVIAAATSAGKKLVDDRLDLLEDQRKHELALMREERKAVEAADRVLLADGKRR
jgi:hypothetical protein